MPSPTPRPIARPPLRHAPSEDPRAALLLGPYVAGRAVEISALAWEARRHAQALAMALEHDPARLQREPSGAAAALSEVAHAERRLVDVAGVLRTARERFEALPLPPAGGQGIGEGTLREEGRR